MKDIETEAQLKKVFINAHTQFRKRVTGLKNFAIPISQNDTNALSVMLVALIEARKRIDKIN